MGPQQDLADPGHHLDSTQPLDLLQAAFLTLERSGVRAFTEVLLLHAREDVEVRPYSAGGEVLHGATALRAFVDEAEADGLKIQARGDHFAVEDESVIVSGSIRVVRGDGSFAETKVSWHYHFEDGLIDVMGWEPRAGSEY